MRAEPEQPDGRLEHLLRRWGAEEAATEAQPGPLPIAAARRPVPQRVGWGPFVLRWLPLAASLVLLAGAAGMFLAAKYGPPDRGRARAARPSEKRETRRLRAELTRATGELKASRTALAEAEQLIAKQSKLFKGNEQLRADLELARIEFRERDADLRKEIRGLNEHLTAAKAQLDAEIEKRVAPLKKTIADKETELEKAVAGLKQSEKQLGDLTKHLAAAREEQKKLRERLDSEAARLRRMHETASAGRLRAETRLSAMQAQQHVLRGMLQRRYLAAGAPGAAGVRARQLAARKNHLLRRCAELRRRAHSKSARKLLDTLEVVLTRLDLLDANKSSEADAFTASVKRVGLIPRIDEVLLAGDEGPAALAWLLETQLVLMGM